ncbi:MAG: hypothetical protein AAGI12_01515 [Pseudomonadota bacterium]
MTTVSTQHSGASAGSSQAFGKQLARALPYILIVVVVLLGILYLLTRNPSLDRSILGFEGFTLAARQAELPIVNHSGGTPLDTDTYGLRILPLYDRELRFFRRARTDNDLDSVLREIPLRLAEQKIQAIPTLLVLPKWRRGAVRLETLHEDLLINPQGMSLMGRSFDFYRPFGIVQGPAEFVSHPTRVAFPPWLDEDRAGAELSDTNDFNVTLYAPQTLLGAHGGANGSPSCRTLITWNRNTLLAQCRYEMRGVRNSNSRVLQSFFVLTDPDVLNNHGAGHGDNFNFGLALVNALSKDQPVVMDLSNTPDRPRQRQRDGGGRAFSDLLQFFQPPFTLFWLVFALLALATLWRASIRLSPVRDREDVRTLGASRASMVAAEAAIFRAGGSAKHDRRLAKLYTANRIADLENQLLGAAAFGQKGKALVGALERRNPNLSERLKKLRETKPTDNPANIAAHLKTLEQTLIEIRNEFGKPASTR